MKTKQNQVLRTGMKVGAVLGVVAFLIFGIIPGFHYGGYGMLMLLGKLAGGPLEMTLAIRLLLVLGILLGILCIGFASIVIGSVFGTIAGYVVNAVGFLREPEMENGMAENKNKG